MIQTPCGSCSGSSWHRQIIRYVGRLGKVDGDGARFARLVVQLKEKAAGQQYMSAHAPNSELVGQPLTELGSSSACARWSGWAPAPSYDTGTIGVDITKD